MLFLQSKDTPSHRPPPMEALKTYNMLGVGSRPVVSSPQKNPPISTTPPPQTRMGNVPEDDVVKCGMKEICYQDEVCDVVQGGVQDDVCVQDEARSEFQSDDSMNAEPNDSMSVAELSQSSSANTLSSAKTRKESANNLSASFKNIRYKTILKVKTVSEGQFTLAKGSPVSVEKLEKYNIDKNAQKAADNVK